MKELGFDGASLDKIVAGAAGQPASKADGIVAVPVEAPKAD
jgi:hypothetical protein